MRRRIRWCVSSVYPYLIVSGALRILSGKSSGASWTMTWRIVGERTSISNDSIMITNRYSRTMWILMLFLSRLFHLSFELGVQCLYACQCGMGENTILIDISRGGGLYGVFKPIAQRSLILAEADISLRKTSAKADIRSAIFSLSMLWNTRQSVVSKGNPYGNNSFACRRFKWRLPNWSILILPTKIGAEEGKLTLFLLGFQPVGEGVRIDPPSFPGIPE